MLLNADSLNFDKSGIGIGMYQGVSSQLVFLITDTSSWNWRWGGGGED